MNIGIYHINIDALLARMIYRWRIQMLSIVAVVAGVFVLWSGIVPPFWRGTATLSITAAPNAAIQFDGKSWPLPVYAGNHRVTAVLPDGRSSWADLELHAGQTLSLDLPPGLSAPRERPLLSAAPGMHIADVWWADNGWRVTSVPNTPPEPERGTKNGSSMPTARAGQTIAIGDQATVRLPTLDAYAGLADQMYVKGRLREVVYRPQHDGGFAEQERGSIEIRGWGNDATIPVSNSLTLLRFAPDGSTVLEAERVADGGEQVYLLRPNQARVSVVAVPGRIVRLSWQPDSRAVVIHSEQGDHLTLTLVRLEPSIVAAVIADLPRAHYSHALVPLTWKDQELLWVAPDSAQASTLWRASLSTLLPERERVMYASAITMLDDGTVCAAVIEHDAVVIGRYQGELFIGETTLAQVPAAPDLQGIWQGKHLLLASGESLWLFDGTQGEH